MRASARAGRSVAGQGLDGQNLANDLPAGAIRVEDLRQEPEERAPDGIDPFPAVGTFIGLGQEPGRHERTEEQIELEKALLAQMFDALTQGSQAGAPGRKERCMHGQVYILVLTGRPA